MQLHSNKSSYIYSNNLLHIENDIYVLLPVNILETVKEMPKNTNKTMKILLTILIWCVHIFPADNLRRRLRNN